MTKHIGSLTPGATLGPYTITAELGHGGMGVVYTAHNPRLKRQVAIKLLTAGLTRDDTAGLALQPTDTVQLFADDVAPPAKRVSPVRASDLRRLPANP